MLPLSVDSLLDRWLGRLLPPRCVLCGAPGQRPCHDLCVDCECELPWLRSTCLRCGRADPSSSGDDSPAPAAPAVEYQTGCAACLVQPPPYQRCFAACAYDPPVDTMVQALKYGGQLALGRVLGELLARGVADLGLQLDVDCLLPVPLHPRRHAERGYNQSAEIARFAARRFALPVEPRLARRIAESRPQVGLSPVERQVNVRGAFEAASQVGGRRIVIIDDVFTTGSTVAELARALRRAGAMTVDVWCIARASPPRARAQAATPGSITRPRRIRTGGDELGNTGRDER
jgi:ComF family protein